MLSCDTEFCTANGEGSFEAFGLLGMKGDASFITGGLVCKNGDDSFFYRRNCL